MSTTNDTLTPIASTVDISALSCIPITQPSDNAMECALPAIPASTAVTVVPSSEEKRSGHHKSEKKKKKEKHKHKDKDKSKEKHKHKHKDKDKDKHREKKEKEKEKEKSEEMPAAARIKITIPKDKLNLSTESSPNVNTGSNTNTGNSDKNISPQSTRLKIKIPKDRFKGNDGASESSPAQPAVMQGPLKIKIRTDGIPRSSTAAPSPLSLPSSSSSASGMSASHAHPTANIESSANETNRKRASEFSSDNSMNSGNVAKKQPVMPPASHNQGHRPTERQNGRHYNSGSNNKVRGGARGGRQHQRGRGPPPHYPGDRNYYGYSNNREQNHHLSLHHSQQSHNPLRDRYAIVNHSHTGQIADPYFYSNYSLPMYNVPSGYMYDPAVYQQYYQQFQQQQQSSYSYLTIGNNPIIRPDGTIDTSMPPPLLYLNQQNTVHHQAAVSAQQDMESQTISPMPPPLPIGPPPSTPPPPPPSVQD